MGRPGGRGRRVAHRPTGAAVALLLLPLSATGAAIVHRRPRHRIGWLFCATSAALAVSVLAEQLASYLLADAERGSVVAATGWMVWGSLAAFNAGLLPLVTFSLLLFPDGRLPSRNWWPAALLAGLATVAVTAGFAFSPGRFDGYPGVGNPLGVELLDGEVARGVLVAGWVLVLAAVPACAAALVVRYRRASGHLRVQLQWVAAASGLTGVLLVVVEALWLLGSPLVEEPVLLVGLAVLTPLAAGWAILRHRLFDIDVVVHRTLVYSALTVLLGAAYAAGVLVLRVLLSPLTTQNDLAVAGSTLVVAALFGPLRRRVQDAVDRRFFRHRYDARRTVDDFAAVLRAQVDIGAVDGALLRVVDDTLQPVRPRCGCGREP